MLKALGKFFRSDNGTGVLEERFLQDYLNNEPFLSKLEPHVKNNALEEVNVLYKLYKEQREPSFIFTAIQLLHAAKWLSDTDYGNKLRSKLNRLTYKDDYGDPVFDDARAELRRFVQKRLYSIVHAIDGSIDSYYSDCARNCDCEHSLLIQWNDEYEPELDDVCELISETSYLFSNHDIPYSIKEFDSTDPYEYERYVAEMLCLLGWDAHATTGSGDQGTDVIAEKNNIKLIVQCKL